MDTQNKELFTALVEVQKEVLHVKKESNNPFFKSQYADLASVWSVCKTVLSKNGLSVIQCPGRDENGPYLETILAHTSGQSITSKTPLFLAKQDMQALGSAITYARRYALMSMVGIAPEDDDGNEASQLPQKSGEKEFKALKESLAKATTTDHMGKIQKWWENKIDTIPDKMYSQGIDMIYYHKVNEDA